ncbi:hypothetical protein [Lentzea waywayandensis]|nr:hypothetical protein [Lentzea waywayandensis]
MRPDPFNEFQARAQRDRERAKRREESEEGLRRQVESGGLDVGMVVMAVVVLVALLIFFLAITPSGTW